MLRCSWRKQDSAFREALYKIQKSAALRRHSATMNFPGCASLNNDPRTSLRFAIVCGLRAIRVQDENQRVASLAASESFIAIKRNRRARALSAFIYDLGDLLAKEFGATGS